MKRVVCFIGVMLFFAGIMPVMAHPGRTNSSGCHVCRTNCASWGLSNGEYHCHNGSSSSSNNRSSAGSSSSAARQVSKETYVYGCMDSSAYNYNPRATKDDGSCVAKKYGCMDNQAINYDPSANISDDTCHYKKLLVVKKKIKFETNYKNSDEMLVDEKETVVEGINGEKEITYDAVVDKDGNVISKEMVNEVVIKEPVNKVVKVGTKETDSTLGVVIWIICLIFAFYYANSHRDGKLLLNKIFKQNKYIRVLLYLVYIFFVLPVFIDIVLIIIDIIKKRK